jgi:hypothetical protein
LATAKKFFFKLIPDGDSKKKNFKLLPKAFPNGNGRFSSAK